MHPGLFDLSGTAGTLLGNKVLEKQTGVTLMYGPALILHQREGGGTCGTDL